MIKILIKILFDIHERLIGLLQTNTVKLTINNS